MSQDLQTLTSTLATISDASQIQPTQTAPTTAAAPVPPPAIAPTAAPAPAPAPVSNVANPETPAKRRPGRPKGSGKKQLEALSLEPRIKRPVGRPRKDGLPAGSAGPKRPVGRPRKRPPGEFASGAQTPAPTVFTPYPTIYGQQWATSVSAPPMASLSGRPVEAPIAIDPNLDPNDWQSLRYRPDILLHNLVASLQAPNPMPTSGVRVEDAFEAHLRSLQANGKSGGTANVPQLYLTLKTFWMPSSPTYFALTTSAATTPSEYRFFYWDPFTFCFNGIPCPACGENVQNGGRIVTGPIKVYDLGKPFFIIGCEYFCASEKCRALSSQGRKFASTDISILRALPERLRDEFPAKLIQGPPHAPDLGSGPEIWRWNGMGVSNALWSMVRACLNIGMRKDVILGIVRGVIDGVPEDPIPAWYAPPPVQPQPQPQPQHQLQPQQPQPQVAQTKQDVEMNDQQDAEGSQDGGEGEDDAMEEQSEESRAKAPEQAQYEAWNGAAGNAVAGATNEANGHQINAIIPNQTVQQQQHPQQMQQHLSYPEAPAAAANVPAPQPQPQAHFTTGHHAPYMSFNPYGAPYAYAYPPAPPPGATPLKPSYDGQAEGSASASAKRIRHCVKCGSHECKGKGGRAFCKNPCQDCGRLECQGRNSKRPDRSCKDAWEAEQQQGQA